VRHQPRQPPHRATLAAHGTSQLLSAHHGSVAEAIVSGIPTDELKAIVPPKSHARGTARFHAAGDVALLGKAAVGPLSRGLRSDSSDSAER
jgi:hypothetical protein